MKVLGNVSVLHRMFASSLLGVGIVLGTPNPSYSISFQIDYTYDTGFFTGNDNRKARLEEALGYFTSFTDTLNAICESNCGGSNNWTPRINNPATGDPLNLTANLNLFVPTNTIIIYAGGRDLGTTTLGVGGAGGFTDTSTTLVADINGRGQTGALASTPTDYATWGGSISFTTNTSVIWNFGDINSLPTTGQNDFLSVAIHELGHVMGLNSTPNKSWSNQISSGKFTGASSTLVNGGVNPSLASGNAHWESGTTSTLPMTNTSQETLMSPSITVGTRKLMTKLDYAGFKDIGWQVPDNLTGVPFDFKPDMAIASLGVIFVGYRLRKFVSNKIKS